MHLTLPALVLRGLSGPAQFLVFAPFHIPVPNPNCGCLAGGLVSGSRNTVGVGAFALKQATLLPCEQEAFSVSESALLILTFILAFTHQIAQNKCR